MGIAAVLVLLQLSTPAADALDRAVSQVFVVDPQWIGPAAEAGTDRGVDTRAAEDPRPVVRDSDLLVPVPLPVIEQRADLRPAGFSPCAPPDVCAADAQLQHDPIAALAQPRGRGILVPLYASFAILQGLDIHSTRVALARGAVESNPLAAGLVNRPAAFIAVKAGAVAGTVFLTEKVRPHSRVGAIILMGALNSLYATVVAHNYRVAAHAR